MKIWKLIKYLRKAIGGAPDAVKVACPVLVGGKAGDYIKGLPIDTIRNSIINGVDLLSCIRASEERTEFRFSYENASICSDQ